MRLSKVVCLLLALVIVSGCSSKRSGGSGNIPLAVAGKELKDVNFAFDSYVLDSGAKATLKNNADWLTKNNRRSVQIEGHCDERGTNEYNMVLGANRARSVMNYMRSLGVSADRMDTVSYGEELPLDPRHTEAAWSKNRRAHFSLVN